MNDENREAMTEPASPVDKMDLVDKMDRESANRDFGRFAVAMDLDLAAVGLGSDDKADLEGAKEKVVAALRRGSLVINEAGEPVFTPQRSGDMGEIRFPEPTGAALMEMDKTKKTADIRKTFVLLQSLTGQPQGTFAKMKMGDLKVCLAVLTLFLG